jgi:hypothetical protein
VKRTLGVLIAMGIGLMLAWSLMGCGGGNKAVEAEEGPAGAKTMDQSAGAGGGQATEAKTLSKTG